MKELFFFVEMMINTYVIVKISPKIDILVVLEKENSLKKLYLINVRIVDVLLQRVLLTIVLKNLMVTYFALTAKMNLDLLIYMGLEQEKVRCTCLLIMA